MAILKTVPNMSSEHCKQTLASALQKVHGVDKVKIDLETKVIEIHGNVNENIVDEVIKRSGYTIG